jgi:hypothetical protein
MIENLEIKKTKKNKSTKIKNDLDKDEEVKLEKELNEIIKSKKNDIILLGGDNTKSIKKTLINENEIITNNVIDDENNLNNVKDKVLVSKKINNSVKKTSMNENENEISNDNVDENEINLNEYKLKNICFNGSSELISKLKPCYIDTDEKIIHLISLPCEKLLICKKILIEKLSDFDLITNKPGLYWITTNEPINHCLNSGVNCLKNINNDTKIIYNGSSCNIRSRIKEHLYRSDEKCGEGTQSGISIDILNKNFDDNKKISHIKCLWDKNKKTPKYFKEGKIKKINNKNDIINDIYFSKEEINIIKNKNVIYFKNGINIFDDKHKNFNWIVYYLEIDNHNIRDYIEIEWRKKYGIPQLCSYISGR